MAAPESEPSTEAGLILHIQHNLIAGRIVSVMRTALVPVEFLVSARYFQTMRVIHPIPMETSTDLGINRKRKAVAVKIQRRKSPGRLERQGRKGPCVIREGPVYPARLCRRNLLLPILAFCYQPHFFPNESCPLSIKEPTLIKSPGAAVMSDPAAISSRHKSSSQRLTSHRHFNAMVSGDAIRISGAGDKCGRIGAHGIRCSIRPAIHHVGCELLIPDIFVEPIAHPGAEGLLPLRPQYRPACALQTGSAATMHPGFPPPTQPSEFEIVLGSKTIHHAISYCVLPPLIESLKRFAPDVSVPFNSTAYIGKTAGSYG